MTTLIRAAQYVRMSTEHQQYSTENQADVIREYAERHGIEVVRTFTDAGKSGLRMHGRDALRSLIDTVTAGNADFTAILAYDVSRWGRFQDADESAFYEYTCKRAGITVHYCAEQFANDGTIGSTIIKTVKRAMAGEYSRELSAKVFKGQCRLIEIGFRQGGVAGFGLRRMLVNQAGETKGILQHGEQKSIQTDRVMLVPGPQEEIEVVHRIYRLFIDERRNEAQIASILNEAGTERWPTSLDGYVVGHAPASQGVIFSSSQRPAVHVQRSQVIDEGVVANTHGFTIAIQGAPASGGPGGHLPGKGFASGGPGKPVSDLRGKPASVTGGERPSESSPSSPGLIETSRLVASIAVASTILLGPPSVPLLPISTTQPLQPSSVPIRTTRAREASPSLLGRDRPSRTSHPRFTAATRTRTRRSPSTRVANEVGRRGTALLPSLPRRRAPDRRGRRCVPPCVPRRGRRRGISSRARSEP